MSNQPYPAQQPHPPEFRDWRTSLPVLAGRHCILRELRDADASTLFAMLATEEVSRFVSPPPASVEGFERFIAACHASREAGHCVSYGVVPAGMATAIGIFQLRSIEPGFRSCEWGFAIGSPFWGTGVFVEGARLIVDFGIDVVRVERFEARAAVANGRGNGALRKIGAVQEGVLRRSVLRNGHCHDQLLWSILAEDWRLQRVGHRSIIH
ncbi:MAG TPA: GNAT family N-acetyltransferase [Vicinamibacterales bacterium]